MASERRSYSAAWAWETSRLPLSLTGARARHYNEEMELLYIIVQCDGAASSSGFATLRKVARFRNCGHLTANGIDRCACRSTDSVAIA